MASIASLLVSLKTDFGSSDSSISSLITKLTQLGQEADKVGEKAHGAGEELKHTGQGAEEGGGGLETLKEGFSELSAEMIAFGAEALALTSIFEALKEAVEVSAELESTKVALESLTGSAEKATEVLENMEKVANSEGLSFAELVPAAQHMVALGFTVEQTTEAIKAAGNAAWALGEPIGTVSQRIGMIAQTGRVSNLFLRTLGLTTEDLGKVMGISAGEVTKAMQALTATDRIEIMTAALEKYGDVGSKEAETVKGKWNELKNSWHTAFGSMGDDLMDITKSLESFVSVLGEVFAAVEKISPIAGLAALIKDVKDLRIPTFVPGNGPEEIGTVEGSGGQPKEGNNEIKEHTEKALEPLHAKEEAGTRLAEIKGEEDKNSRLAQLNREKVEASIKAEHELRQAEIDENEDSIERARQAATEEIRVAQERQERIGEIDAEEAKEKAKLVKARVGPEIAKTYTPIPDEGKRSAEISAINQKASNDLSKIVDDLTLKQQKAADAVAEAVSKQIVAEAKITLGQTKTERDVSGSQIKNEADVKAIGYQEDKIRLEGEYEAQISHTYSEQIQHLNEIASLEKQGRDANIEGLEGQLKNIPSTINDDAAIKKRADIQNQITKAKAESSKADAESANAITKADDEHLKAIREVTAIKLKSDSDTAAEKINQDKIKIEAEYAALLAHTNEDEITHLTQVAALEEAQRQSKIAGLKNQLSNVPTGDDPEFAKKRADLEAQIKESTNQADTARLQSVIQITQQMEAQNKLLTAQKELAQALTEWSKIGLGSIAQQITESVISLPGKLGTSFASSLFNAPKRGESKITEIGHGAEEAVKKTGEDLAGKLISSAIQKLVTQLIGQVAIDSLNNSITAANTAALLTLASVMGANTGATVAHTGVLGAHLGVMTTHLGVMLTHTIVMIGNTISTIANTIATWAEAVASLFGFAEGGDPDPNKPFIAGEKGPEVIHPKGKALTVIPNGPTKDLLKNYNPKSFRDASNIDSHSNTLNSTQPISNNGTHTSTSSNTFGDIHVHMPDGITNPRQHAEEMVRHIPNVIKARTSKSSPLS